MRSRSRRRRTRKRGGGLLTVRFAEGLASRNYPLFKARDTPVVTWPQQSDPVTLLCWDPDAPQASWLHWMVINCGGTDPNSGTTVVPWAPPSPPSGTHRYIFALYRSKNPVNPGSYKRPGFDPAAFATANGMTQLDWAGIKSS
jgi:phosphatidylethanolamine-binding protein (PEBP) family uncharacterized protein